MRMTQRYNLGSLAAQIEYSADNYTLASPDPAVVAALVNGLLTGSLQSVGQFNGNPQIQVANINGALVAYATRYDGGFAELPNATIISPRTHPTLPWQQMMTSDIEVIGAAALLPKVNSAGGCPPPDNCQEKWVTKTLHVSAYPSDDAIAIPVAFKKVVCDIESDTPPEIDCDDLLEALTQSVEQGAISNVAMAGLANDYRIGAPSGSMDSTPANLPPDWCNDCEEKLVKATAYVSERPTTGSKPFDVKMKVIVCDATGDPQIDCATAIEAIKAGMKEKGWKALSGLGSRWGLSEATAATDTDDAFIDGEAVSAGEASTTASQAGFSPLLWILLAAVGVGFYAMNK